MKIKTAKVGKQKHREKGPTETSSSRPSNNLQCARIPAAKRVEDSSWFCARCELRLLEASLKPSDWPHLRLKVVNPSHPRTQDTQCRCALLPAE